MILKKKEIVGFKIIFNTFGQIKIKRNFVLKTLKGFYCFIS